MYRGYLLTHVKHAVSCARNIILLEHEQYTYCPHKDSDIDFVNKAALFTARGINIPVVERSSCNED